ncbi:hypothetical protein OJ998_23665 [Solirubrobacter taibaiensis]|nr:hypothetical protein [Solirubrobacter taibaiensis]
MPWFVTIGYGDAAGYEQTDSAVLDKAHAADARLGATGAVMGIAGTPIQVRNHDGAKVEITQGAYLRSELPIAGLSVFEATDLEHATRLISDSPCAVAQGVIEVWPLVDSIDQR